MNLEIPPVPDSYDTIKMIASQSENSSEVYEVNLHQMTCTCYNFQNTRLSRPKYSISRMCKHLLNEYRDTIGLKGLSGIELTLVKNGFPTKGFFREITISNHFPVIGNYDSPTDWWQIYVQDKDGNFKDYGFLPGENRWSYGSKPNGIVLHIRNEIKSFIESRSSSGSVWVDSDTNNEKKPIVNQQGTSDSTKGCLYLGLIIVVLFLLMKAC